MTRMRNVAIILMPLLIAGFTACEKKSESSAPDKTTQPAVSTPASTGENSAVRRTAEQEIEILRCVSWVENSTHPFQRAGAIRKLGWYKATERFPLIAAGLKDDNLRVRIAGALALGMLEEPDAVGFLREALKADEPELRLAASAALGRIGPAARPAVADLIVLLRSPTVVIRTKLFRCPSGPKWRDLYNDRSPRLPKTVISALGHIGGPEAIEAIASTLNEQSLVWTATEALRRLNASDALLSAAKNGHIPAIRTLSKMKDKRVLPYLLKAFKTASARNRSLLASSIGTLGDRRGLEPLVAALNDPAPNVRRYAAQALGYLKDPRALPHLIKLVETQGLAGYSATCAIGQIGGEQAQKILVQLSSHPSPLVREGVIYGLRRNPCDGNIAIIIRLLKDPHRNRHGDFSVRDSAASSLAKFGQLAVKPLLAELPKAGPELRTVILRALGRITPLPPETAPVIGRYVGDPHQKAAWIAVEILWCMRDPAMPLERFLKLRGNGLQLQSNSAMSEIKSSDVLAIKAILAKGKKHPFRRTALSYLVKTAPREAWPLVKEYLISSDDKDNLTGSNILRGHQVPPWLQEKIIALLQPAQSLTPNAKRTLLGVLENCYGPAIEKVLYQCAGDDSYRVRSGAFRHLIKTGKSEALEFVMEAARNGRLFAQIAVAGSCDKRATKTIVELLNDSSSEDRHVFVSHLGGARNPEIMAALRKAAQSDNSALSQSAQYRLRELEYRDRQEPH